MLADCCIGPLMLSCHAPFMAGRAVSRASTLTLKVKRGPWPWASMARPSQHRQPSAVMLADRGFMAGRFAEQAVSSGRPACSPVTHGSGAPQ